MVAVVTLMFAFRSSEALAYAYGMAVIATIVIATMLFLYIAPRPLAGPELAGDSRRRRSAAGINLTFLAANLTKIIHGAWLPLLIGARPRTP